MKNLEKLKTLRTMLGCEHIIITGSNAIKLHGMPVNSNEDDLDLILVNPPSDAISVLDRFQKEKPNPKFIGGGDLKYSFYFENVKIDVWISQTQTTECLTYEGFLVQSISDIVSAKVSYGRPKDYVQLLQWSSKIFHPSYFDIDTVVASRDSSYNS